MRRDNYLIKLAVINLVIVVIVDQITKYAIYSRFALYETKAIIPGLFNLVFFKNPGSSFSILADAAPWFRVPFFLIVPSVAMIIIIILLKKSSGSKEITREKKMEIFSFSFILGGALGNFMDRLHHEGYAVVDFLQVCYKDHCWPSFNVADISITIGILLLFLSLTLADRNKKRVNKEESAKRI
jgi:signal peptidase II